MNLSLRTVKQMAEESAGYFKYYVPETDEFTWIQSNGHDKAGWTAALMSVTDALSVAGYSNATIIRWQGIESAVVDEDYQMYRNEDRRLSIYDVVKHCGMGAGCAWNNTAQLIGFTEFQRRGLDETHGSRGWTTAPCRQCFPARYAEAVRLGAKP